MPKETKVARIPVPRGQFLEDQPEFLALVERGWKPLFTRTVIEDGVPVALVDLERVCRPSSQD